jgi:hypothetical protein
LSLRFERVENNSKKDNGDNSEKWRFMAVNLNENAEIAER